MATHDYVIDNSTGANVRADINNALSAIVSNNSNSSEPSTKYAYQWWADTSNATLKLRNSSNDGWLTLFTLTGGVDVDSASSFNEDIVFHGASNNIRFDKSDNELQFEDGAKATFGTDVDLSISHDGTTFQIFGTGAGKATVQIEGEGGADPTINFLANNTQHFSIGIDDSDSDKFKISKHSALGTNDYFTLDTSGNIDVTGNFNLPDNAELRLGSDATNGDLQIYHNGTHNYIDTDTNKIHIRVNANENAIVANSNGSVEIYNDGSLRLESQSAGVEITGKLTFANDGLANGSIDLGADADLNLYHDNSDAFFDNNKGDFYIRNSGSNPNQIYIQGKGGENGITVNGDGAVQIYHDHSETLVTTASGITVTGAVTDSKGSLRSIPSNYQTSAYTLVASDAGKAVIQAGQTSVTIPNSTLTGGDAVTIINGNTGSISIVSGTGLVLFFSADGTQGNRTLGARGIATVYFHSATYAYISGSGLT